MDYYQTTWKVDFRLLVLSRMSNQSINFLAMLSMLMTVSCAVSGW